MFLGKHALYSDEPSQLHIPDNTAFFKHPGFKFTDTNGVYDLVNDIALVRLSVKVDFSGNNL